ncbi:fibroblast growth factor 12-like [Antedon mediterranea]|uniref:fibroblast growth factor 12-like n=1 Tax=Antedon mediterranea TaxID=105859 RepID=UPI003AF7EAA7
MLFKTRKIYFTWVSLFAFLNLSVSLQVIPAVYTKITEYNEKRFHASTENANKIVSRNGFFLWIGPDGRVRGTDDCNNRYVRVATFAVSPSLIIIRGSESGLYLSMTKAGKVSARNDTAENILSKENSDILWREKFSRRSCFVTFQSLAQFRVGKQVRSQTVSSNGKRRGRYLSIGKGGRATSSANNVEFKSNFILIS